MNWKLRIKNKATLTALVVAIIALVYQVLGIAGVTPAVSQEQAVNAIGVAINVLMMLGIVVDPTTEGIADSHTALTYGAPKSIAVDSYQAVVRDNQDATERKDEGDEPVGSIDAEDIEE